MMKHLLLILGSIIIVLLAGCEAEYQGPLPLSDNYNVPAYTAANPVVKLFVNDQTSRVVYVNEEFEVKVALYDMPQTLSAVSMDIILGSNIQVERIMYDTSSAGYFARKESTLTVCLSYPQVTATKVSFVKTYLNGTTPHVGSKGILFKLRCKAVSRSNGVFALGATEPVCWVLNGGGVVGVNTNVTQFTPIISPVALNVKDDLFVP